MQLGILTASRALQLEIQPVRGRLTPFPGAPQPDHDRVGGFIETVISGPSLDMLRGNPRGFEK
jgi:hypothetical protein